MDELLVALRRRCIRRGEFTLSSGAKSNYYVDLRLATMSARGMHLIGGAMRWLLDGLSFDSVGGLEVGAIPVTCAILAGFMRPELEGFWVRRSGPKGHGTASEIEGCVGHRVLIVDDVLTTGASTMRAVSAARARGCEVVGVAAVVDRHAGARELLESRGVRDIRTLYSITLTGGDRDKAEIEAAGLVPRLPRERLE